MKKDLCTAFNKRQYMLAQNFELFYYTDTNIKNVKEHSHNYYEFYFFVDGCVSINIAGKDYPLTSGDMILIPPKTIHYVNISDQSIPYQRFVFWLSKEYWQELLNQSPDYGYLIEEVLTNKNYIYHNDIISFNIIKSKIFQLIEEMRFERFGKITKTSLCVNDLILHLNRAVYESTHPNVHIKKLSLYQKVVTYIEEHIEEENLSLDHLAKVFYVSKYHISHVFKENLGLSVYQYILKKRLTMCRDAIISNTKISKAYLQCGFKDYSSFYRAFKKEYGISPSDYQEIHCHQLQDYIKSH